MTVDDLRRTIDLYNLVGRDTHLRKAGANWYAGPCPFCGGRDRFTLKRTSDGWRWLCRNCTDGKYLDAVDYIQRRDNLDFRSAVKALGGEAFSSLRDDDLPPFVQKPKPVEPPPQDPQTIERLTKIAYRASSELDAATPLAVETRAYLDRRGIIEPTRQRALLGAKMVFDPKAQRQRVAAAIPYFDKALSVRAIKYRFCDDLPGGLRYSMERGSQSGFYYLPEHLGHFDRLLILEGEINYLSVCQTKPELDIISTGSQTVSEAMKQVLSVLAARYRRIWAWFDDPQKAAEVARLVRGVPVQSPVVDGEKWDANRLLQDDLLHDFITRLTGVKCFGWTLKGWKNEN
jgi:hypothetical protein